MKYEEIVEKELIDENALKEWLGYRRRGDLERTLRENAVPIIYGKNGRICTTMEALEKAMEAKFGDINLSLTFPTLNDKSENYGALKKGKLPPYVYLKKGRYVIVNYNRDTRKQRERRLCAGSASMEEIWQAYVAVDQKNEKATL